MKKGIHKSFAVVVAIMAMFTLSLTGQNMHIIGEGTIESHYPTNNIVFEYGWATMMYSSDEMGEAKSIMKIAFDQTTDYGEYWEYAVLDNQKIYIKQTADTEFSSLTYEDPENEINGYTLVYDGTIQFNLGWTQIELSEAFDYDGSSSFIVHWENHRGTSAPIINVKFNASSVSGDVFKALGGDVVFPTAFGTFINDRPNIALYFQGDGPDTPSEPLPANNSNKALLDTDLEFHIGSGTATYDVYFGTTNPPVEKIVSDAPVTSPDVYSCNPSEISGQLLDDYALYYWQVVAKDGDASSPSAVWNFRTQGVIKDFPYFTSFEDKPIRTQYADTVDWSWPLAGGVNWHTDSTNVKSGSYSVGCNVWSTTGGSYSLVSPRVLLPENQRVNFWWRHSRGAESEIDVYFEITDDGGENWETLYHFDPGVNMDDFDQLIINLNAYAGNNVYLRWRYESWEEYSADYIFIDDLAIENIPAGAVIQIEQPSVNFPILAVGAETYLPLEITNVGSEDLVITGSTMNDPYSFINPGPIAPGATVAVQVYVNANAIGDQNQSISFTGEFTGEDEVQLTASVYETTYDFFYNADLSNELPENWSVIRTLDPYDSFTDVSVVSTVYDAYSPPNAFRMTKMNDTISPLMFISEGVSGYASNKLVFYAKKSYDDYDASIEVGLTNDPLHADAFTVYRTFEMTTAYQKFEVDFPGTATEPYIAFKFIDGRYASSIWLEDIEWDVSGSYPPYCPVMLYPQAEDVDIDVMMGLTLNWTSGGGNPTGYKLSIGTDENASDILNAEDVGGVVSYDFPITPEYGETYYWKLTAYNPFGESSSCETQSFTIMENPLTYTPFEETFDELDAFGERDYPLGWSIENANNDNFPWDLISDVSTPGVAHSTPNAMHMLFSLSPMDDYLFTPPISLNSGDNYELSFWYKTMGDQWVPDPVERMKVLVGNDNNSTAMTLEVFDNPNIDNQDWAEAKVTFSVEASGEYYLGFFGYSIAYQGLLLLDDVKLDKLSSLADNPKNNIVIYPNPVTDQLNIKAEHVITNISIHDLSGSLVKREDCNNQNVSLSTSQMASGIYIINIETKDDVTRKKLIVR